MDDEIIERVRRGIYDTFARTGHAPDREQLAALAGVDAVQIDDAVARLAAARHLALDEAGTITMAHPFTSLNLGFSVMGRETLWWGGCAWDSFAIPNLIHDEPRVLVATSCPACGRALAWNVTRFEAPDGDEVAHFLVPMSAVWDDVVFTCSHQRLFCNTACVHAWLDRTGHAQGYVLDLTTLWQLAHDWYTGRLDSPYQRKDPQTAKNYFRSVGLHGPFWGLDD
jgi:hypothetical protein